MAKTITVSKKILFGGMELVELLKGAGYKALPDTIAISCGSTIEAGPKGEIVVPFLIVSWSEEQLLEKE